MAGCPKTPEDLLLHAGFVRSLAQALMGQEGEDLAQEAWLRAIASPPRHGRVLRGWWRRIVARLAANRRREESRRAARERAVAEPAAAPSPVDILAREEVRRRVVEAVLDLEEPFRQVVLLRFYEDLSPKAIAGMLGIPDSTVRTRLKRGIERLRCRLDAGHGGDRRAWTAMLTPWVRPRAAHVPATLESPDALRLQLDPLRYGGEPIANSVVMQTVELRPGEETLEVLQVLPA